MGVTRAAEMFLYVFTYFIAHHIHTVSEYCWLPVTVNYNYVIPGMNIHLCSYTHMHT